MASPLLILHYGKTLPRLFPKNDVATRVVKLAYDQICFVPVFLTLLFFTMAKVEGVSNPEARQITKQKVIERLPIHWTWWPFIQFANFTFTPVAYHIFVINTINIWWNSRCYYNAALIN